MHFKYHIRAVSVHPPFLIPYEPYFQILLEIEAQIPVSVCFFSKVTHRDRDLRTRNILLFLT